MAAISHQKDYLHTTVDLCTGSLQTKSSGRKGGLIELNICSEPGGKEWRGKCASKSHSWKTILTKCTQTEQQHRSLTCSGLPTMFLPIVFADISMQWPETRSSVLHMYFIICLYSIFSKDHAAKFSLIKICLLIVSFSETHFLCWTNLLTPTTRDAFSRFSSCMFSSHRGYKLQ